jgi:hypothetical protein
MLIETGNDLREITEITERHFVREGNPESQTDYLKVYAVES